MTAKLKSSSTKPKFSSGVKSSSGVIGFLLPGIIFLGGIALTLWMQTFTRNGVVFSGDAGLKAMLSQRIAQQLSTGSFPLDMALSLPTPEWVTNLWQQGLYPFKPPFVYEVGTQHFITFPFTFPLVSAPFYALFGDAGLYVVPLVALWAIWLRFWQISKRANWGLGVLCIGLITLIFASPLSLYAGMYWEHTLAVALAFWGVSALAFPPVLDKGTSTGTAQPSVRTTSLSKYQMFSSGVLIGLSVWFRPEFLCLVAAVSLLALIGWLLPKWRLSPPLTLTKAAILVGAMFCTIGVFFALNYGIYGHPLGIHAIQIVEESTPGSQIAEAKKSYGQLFQALVRYFPTVIVVAIAALFSPEFKKASLKTANRFRGFKTPNVEQIGIVTSQKDQNVPGRFALALSILFALSVPLIVPPGAGGKQWGPRFYLILVPLLTLVLTEQLRSGFFRGWARQMALGGAAVAIALGIHLNTFHGAFHSLKEARPVQSTSLKANHTPIAPAIAHLQADALPWIAMSNEFVAQQLWIALPEKTFFLTETITEVKQLSAALSEQGESEFLYVCYPHRDCPTPDSTADERTLEGGQTINFQDIGTHGKYPMYKVEIAS